MERLTYQDESGCYRLSGDLQEAIQRLGTFETLYETIVAEQEDAGAKLSALRLAGKEKTCQARELTGKRLLNANLLSLSRRAGITSNRKA